jgi:hypothetical protein
MSQSLVTDFWGVRLWDTRWSGRGQFFSTKLYGHHLVSKLNMSEHFLGSNKAFEILANLGLDPLLVCAVGWKCFPPDVRDVLQGNHAGSSVIRKLKGSLSPVSVKQLEGFHIWSAWQIPAFGRKRNPKGLGCTLTQRMCWTQPVCILSPITWTCVGSL